MRSAPLGKLGLLGPAATALLAGFTSRSDSYAVCPSSGPTILGIEWNCIAELDLTVVLLMLAAVAIVAYVFWDDEAAELPGESSEVPLTEEDWAKVRHLRRTRLEGREPDAADPPGAAP